MAKTAAKTKEAVFKFFAPQAKRVFLAGQFNNWNTSSLSAKKDAKGNWSVKVALKPGKYEYKFFVDGSWVNDPNASYIPNSLGTQNSVIEVK